MKVKIGLFHLCVYSKGHPKLFVSESVYSLVIT